MPATIGDDALPSSDGQLYTILIREQQFHGVTQKDNDPPRESSKIFTDTQDGKQEQGFAKCMIPEIKKVSSKERYLHVKWLYNQFPELNPSIRSGDALDQFLHDPAKIEAVRMLGLRHVITLSIRNDWNFVTHGGYIGGGPLAPPIGWTTDSGEKASFIKASVYDLKVKENSQVIDIEVRRPYSAAVYIWIPYFNDPNTESEACQKLGEALGKYFSRIN